MPDGTGCSDLDEAGQYGDEAASDPEPTGERRGYEGNHGEVYRPRTRVRVLVRDDRHANEIGRVQRTYNDGGDMTHVLLFEDGTTAEYHYDDLTRP